VVFGEINTLAPALAAGRLSASRISDNSSSVNSSLWQDPDTGNYYLIAVNTSATAGNATFTLALSGLGISVVQPLFENRQPASFSGNKFTDSFSSYQVHVYELTFVAVAQISGDANGDGAVNVSDLSLLAANYGVTSGATWAMGDFTGDGAVNVSDLSLLAANYGTGSASTLDFAQDYATVFGTSDANETSDVSADDGENTSSTVCSSLGLSLIAGLAMMGLMLVKLED
jgi:hypothetical protein